jgi:hypothetical protein
MLPTNFHLANDSQIADRKSFVDERYTIRDKRQKDYKMKMLQ